MVEAVPLDGGELVFVLLDDLLQSAVQVLLLLLKELLLLGDGRQIIHDVRERHRKQRYIVVRALQHAHFWQTEYQKALSIH